MKTLELKYDLGTEVYFISLRRYDYTAEGRPFLSPLFVANKTYVDKVLYTRKGITYHTHEGGDYIRYNRVLYTDKAEAEAVAAEANKNLVGWLKSHCYEHLIKHVKGGVEE